MTIPYERIIQWVAGPFSVLVGLLATKLVTNLNWLGQLGLQKSAVAHAIVVGVVFLVSAAVTYLAHAKWMSNLVQWWNKMETNPNPNPSSLASATEVGPGTVDTANKLRAQLLAAGKTPVA